MNALDMETLNKAILNKDMEMMRSFQAQLAVQIVPMVDQNLTQSLSVQETRITASLDRLTKTDLGYLPMDYLAVTPSSVRQLKMSRVLKNVLFCLDVHGQIHMTCLHTLITLQVWSQVSI